VQTDQNSKKTDGKSEQNSGTAQATASKKETKKITRLLVNLGKIRDSPGSF
jgi:hypothetical protein